MPILRSRGSWVVDENNHPTVNNQAFLEAMFFYLDMNQEDISEMTGIPLNTVKSNIFRAKKILSEKLGGLL